MYRSAIRLISNWTSWSLVHWQHGLVLGFGTLLLLIAFVSAISLEAIKDTELDLRKIVDVQFQKLVLSKKMNTAARERTTSITKLMYLDDPFDRDEELMRFHSAAADFIAARRAFQAMDLDTTERQLIEEQGRYTKEAVPYQEQVIKYTDAKDLPKAQTALIHGAIPAQDVVLNTLARLDEHTRDQTRLAMEQASAADQHARRWILLLSVVAVSVGLVVALVVAYLTMRAGIEREILATHDTLTGLPNRMLLLDRLGQALLQARRDQKMVGVLFIDLDRFKIINDSLGHAAGDELIRIVAQRLRTSVRGMDIVARLSGDEFIVLVQNATQVDDVLLVVEKILNTLHQPYDLAGREIFTTCSIGISLYPHDGELPNDLLKHADAAMYQAKEEGRNRYRLFDASMPQIAAKRLETETELRYAIERSELELHYQPQLDLSAGRIIAFEALIRWRHPTHGILAPRHFLGLLEETGLIQEVSGQLLLQACRDCLAWQHSGHPELSVSFNLSAVEFWHANLIDKLRHTLFESGLAPRHLYLELTEGILMENVVMAIQRMDEIKALGIRLSVDDFGTGYSCLAHLKRFPVDEAKIDRYFVADIDHDQQAGQYLKAILALSDSLSLQTIIEGVETTDQLRRLQSMGPHIVQGYLISKPVPASEVSELLSRDWSQTIADA